MRILVTCLRRSPGRINNTYSTIRIHPVASLTKGLQKMYESSSMFVGSNPAPIEVERKFVFTEENKQRILALGAQKIRTKRFRDVYYDTTDYTLTLADHWLRCRNNSWELKCPLVEGVINKGNCSQQYSEQSNVSQIIRTLQKLVKAEVETVDLSDPVDLSTFLEATKCHEIASFWTERHSYFLPEEDVHVDLDTTDFGYSIGEIEIMVPEQQQAAKAVSKIDNLAMSIGVFSKTRVPGKITMYLKQHNPDHYQKIQQHFM